MAVDESPKSGAPAAKPADNTIVSVNDAGRRRGSKAAPFVLIGAIAAVVLIGGLLTVNVVKSKWSPPKPQTSEQANSAAGLSRSFDTGEAKPDLPGTATGVSGTAPVATPTCSDGSQGNELKGQDGVVVRNAQGQGVRVCPNGQVIGPTPPSEAAARPIPVEAATRRPATSSVSTSRFQGLAGTSGSQVMLNDTKSGVGTIASDFSSPQTLVGAVSQVAASAQAKLEGLLTQAPQGSLEAELTPSRTPTVEAARVSDLNMLLPKGHTIDCALSTRIVSSLAGQVSCVLTANVYSANGKVVLLERGSEAVGEYRSGASIGQKRLFVLWGRILTPSGVVINLDSPGADPLGATGLAGKVDDHWFERIGSAFLLSTVQDAIQYEVASQQAKSGSSTFVLSNTAQTGNTMAEKVLESTINIPPTLSKNQGDRAIIYVARDLDFSSVYRLHAQ